MQNYRFDPLSKDEVHKIDLATMEVLEKTGIIVENDRVLELLEQNGAKIDKHEKRAKIPEYVLKDGLKKVPSSFVVYSRRGEKVRIGGDQTVISSGAGATWILDLDTGEPRPATKKDAENYAKVTDVMENFSLCMSPIIQDVTPSLVDVHSTQAMICSTTKTPWVCPGDGMQARYIIEMGAALAGGMEEYRKKPVILGLASPNSPLRLASNDIDVALEFAGNKLPITFINCPNSGATTPVTIAGTLVVTLAECLAFALVAQLINPGNAVAVGPSPPIMDMKTAISAFGAPESGLVVAGAAQMLRYYNVPSYGSITSSESILIDAQTGYEIAWTAQLPMMAGVNLVNGVGLINACVGCSLEKLIIDDEVFGGLKRILKGIEVSDVSLAVDVIEAVGPGGHFLAQKHSREHLRNERWFPKISNRLGLQEWKKEKLDLWQKARREAKKIVESHSPEPLEKEIEEKIAAIVKSAEKKAASMHSG
jgi:trimethylamine--corrinoid protein Co-methyltransferase